MSIVRTFARIVRARPRVAAAAAFGLFTTAVVHFAWIPETRLSGSAPALTFSAGLAHALVAALMGRRIAAPTGSPVRGILLGMATSVIALVLFTPFLVAYISSSDTQEPGMVSSLVTLLLTGIFTFFAVWWALVAASALLGWVLARLATLALSDSDQPSPTQDAR